MIATLSASLGLPLLLLVGLLLLLGLLRVLGIVVEYVPMGADRHETLARARPLVGTLVVLLYMLFAAGVVFKAHPGQLPLALGFVVVGFVVASWTAVRDVVSGVFLKAGRVCRVGDHVRVGNVEGRVERMGLTVLVIETREGDEAVLPYSGVARQSILRTPVIDSVAPHVFRVERPDGLSLSALRSLIRERAMSSHWASITREPDVEPVADDAVEVTVFALDADHAPEVESAVRGALEQPASGAVVA